MNKVFLLFFVVFVSCSQKHSKIYFYELAITTLVGTIVTEQKYGPPGFGENPAEDAKCTIYEIELNEKINVFPNKDADLTDADGVFNISKLQLSNYGNNIEKYVGKNCTIKGNLFHAITGHHYTDVLVQVKEIK